MKIALTYDLREELPVTAEDPQDLNAELDKPETIEFLSAALKRLGHEVIRIGNVHRLIQDLLQGRHHGWDIVFNLCEGRFGRTRESEVPVLLDLWGVDYIGADGLTLALTLDKAMAKKCFITSGVPTPAYFVVGVGDQVPEPLPFDFPMIVKPAWEGTSKGLTRDARVTNKEELDKAIKKVHQLYHQPALIEKFIRGREFTVAVIGNRPAAAQPSVAVSINGRMDLGDEFFLQDYVDKDPDRVNYVCPAPIDPLLEAALRKTALAAYHAVDCRDFGRVDLRVDEHDRIFVLEINPLPSLASNDVFNIFPRALNKTYDDIINDIVTAAWERCRATTKPRAIASNSTMKAFS